MKTLIIKARAKKAFTKTKIPGATWVINQYVGCQHACMYCYAKFMSKWYDYGKWGTWVVVKENLPELVKDERVEGRIYMSSVSDAYQPVEKELKLTRRILENMDKSAELSILTKSNLVLRDVNILKKFENIEVGLTVNGFDRRIREEFEPHAPEHKKRIDALKALHDFGIKNYAFISPIIPIIVDVEEIIHETKDHTDFYWFEFLTMRASGKEFRDWLAQNYPESFKILNDEDKYREYVRKERKIILNSGIKVKGVETHCK